MGTYEVIYHRMLFNIIYIMRTNGQGGKIWRSGQRDSLSLMRSLVFSHNHLKRLFNAPQIKHALQEAHCAVFLFSDECRVLSQARYTRSNFVKVATQRHKAWTKIDGKTAAIPG